MEKQLMIRAFIGVLLGTIPLLLTFILLWDREPLNFFEVWVTVVAAAVISVLILNYFLAVEEKA